MSTLSVQISSCLLTVDFHGFVWLAGTLPVRVVVGWVCDKSGEICIVSFGHERNFILVWGNLLLAFWLNEYSGQTA
jgi:hypothetical protein